MAGDEEGWQDQGHHLAQVLAGLPRGWKEVAAPSSKSASAFPGAANPDNLGAAASGEPLPRPDVTEPGVVTPSPPRLLRWRRLLPQQFVHRPRIRLAAGCAHDLARSGTSLGGPRRRRRCESATCSLSPSPRGEGISYFRIRCLEAGAASPHDFRTGSVRGGDVWIALACRPAFQNILQVYRDEDPRTPTRLLTFGGVGG
jgi:hypothetical protein